MLPEFGCLIYEKLVQTRRNILGNICKFKFLISRQNRKIMILKLEKVGTDIFTTGNVWKSLVIKARTAECGLDDDGEAETPYTANYTISLKICYNNRVWGLWHESKLPKKNWFKRWGVKNNFVGAANYSSLDKKFRHFIC